MEESGLVSTWVEALVQELADKEEASKSSGTHMCGLYKSEEEHAAVVHDFVNEGLALGHKILYYCSKNAEDQIMESLESQGTDVRSAMESGQLKFEESVEMTGDSFDPAKSIEEGALRVKSALAEGYPHVRVLGENHWAAAPHQVIGCERLLEFESRLVRTPLHNFPAIFFRARLMCRRM